MPLEVGLSGGYLKGPNLEHIFNEKLNLYPQSNLTQKKLSCKLSFMFVKLYFMTKREKVEGAKKVLHHIPMKELWIDVLSWVQYAKVLFSLVDIVE